MSGGCPSPASREQWQEAHSVAKTDTAVLEHIPGLRRYARALTGNAADADDLVQECLSRALARRQQARAIRTLRAYPFTILHNAHIDRLSDRRRWNYPLPGRGRASRGGRGCPHGWISGV